MPSSDDDDIQRKDERRARHDRRRSCSRSRSKRDVEKRYSRSRSRSIDRYRRRRSRRSRSRSDSRYSRRHRSSRRYDDSRSRSRSRSSHRSRKNSRNKSHSSSRSPRPSHWHNENKKSCSRSSERYIIKKDKNDSTVRPIDDDNSTEYLSCNADTNANANSLEDLPLPDQAETNSNSYENFADSQEPIDKERIHREIEEKLRQTLAREGKVYPPPKPEASHPVFANDGSFLEIFKKMQEAAHQSMNVASTAPASVYGVATTSTSAGTMYPTTSTAAKTVPQPLVGRRRGGKILKTGVVAKPKAINNTHDDKDFWSLYLAEVNKYKNNACELNPGNRPLLK